ncbi:MAG: hypothetical protein IJJ71_09910 [Treponema sp.]|uniref:hypothetical protein n=1 Tax=Treponema sp. TaxID=166 RepID=UPI0025CC1750|nr:hypothetical protein [Treponema sp.]MBR0496475.1 hypothetical protein [Treponema sp.]
MNEKILAAMDLSVTLAVQEIAEKTNVSLSSALLSFMESNTGRMIYDDSTKLWAEGPSSITDTFLKETKQSAKTKNLL